jgi:hypothetical protein
MPKKLNKFKQDILSLVEKVEPEMLFWREIRDRLWPIYQTEYKDKKVYGVALTNNLTWLQAKRFIKKESDYYGTFNSKIPVIADKPLPDKPIQTLKGVGFWERRAERKRLEREAEEKYIERQILELQKEDLVWWKTFEYYKTHPDLGNQLPPVDVRMRIEKESKEYYGLS